RTRPTGARAAPPFARPPRRRAPPSSPLRAPPRARFAPAPAGTLHPLTEGLSRQLFQTYLSCRSWCASSPKDPVIATSPAYHGHPPQRLLLNSPDTTSDSGCCRMNSGRRYGPLPGTSTCFLGQPIEPENGPLVPTF